MHISCKLITSELQFQSVLAFLYAIFREILPVFFFGGGGEHIKITQAIIDSQITVFTQNSQFNVPVHNNVELPAVI